MKKNLLVVVLALYTSIGCANGMDDLKEAGKSFAKGFGVGVVHGAVNRGINSVVSQCINIPNETYVRQDSPDVAIARVFVSGVTFLGAARVNITLTTSKERIPSSQMAGHALGQMIAEGIEFDKATHKPKVAFSVNGYMLLAVMNFVIDEIEVAQAN